MTQRPIKLRAWDKTNKAFVYLQILGGSTRLVFDSDPSAQMSLDNDWQQLTGLHDKNGKEIWEGDILSTYESVTKKWRSIKVVSWVSKPKKGHGVGFNITGGKLLKVIGNIYENPNLLKP